MIDPLVTQHFRLSEFIESDTATRLGISNTPSPDVLAMLRNVLIPGMEAVRTVLGKPVFVSSGYRSPELNRAIRGAPGSQHLTGQACDFRCPEFGPVVEVCAALVAQMQRIKFDQLIFEGTWCHISFSSHPRNQVLTAHFAAGGVSYTKGLA